MRKLYKLKNWYSLEDAARRLTITLGEDVSVNDLLQLTLEGHLPLSWYARHIPAQEVVPYTSVKKRDEYSRKFGLFNHKPNPETNAVIIDSRFERLSEVIHLNGAYKLDFGLSGGLTDWVLALITNTDTEIVALEGYFVRDEKENLWRIMEARNTDYPKTYGLNPDHSQYVIDDDRYFPRGEYPDQADLGITKTDIEVFETTLVAKADIKHTNPVKILSTTERNSLLKLVIGMAMAGYRYDPKASKNPSVREIADDLQRLGISITDDTVRKWLQEASEFLPQAVENV